MSWYKQSRNKGRSEPRMDNYPRDKGNEYIRNPDGLTTPTGEFGGNERPGYPKGFSKNPENSDDPQWAKLHGTIPGEAVLMDDRENGLGKPGDSDEGLGDRFTSDIDKTPYRDKKLDNIDIGPHNMQNSNVFNRIKNRIKTRGIKL